MKGKRRRTTRGALPRLRGRQGSPPPGFTCVATSSARRKWVRSIVGLAYHDLNRWLPKRYGTTPAESAFVKMNSTPLLVLLLSLAVLFTPPRTQADPIRPKVLILTTFEIGEDTGDRPGELQYWVERERLTGSLDIPGLLHPLRFNDSGVYATLTGTCNRSGLAMMLLGSDPRLDLTQTYFIMGGIAGVDPNRASVGSAAWAQWVVDGDNVNEIDGHAAPKEWPYGILPYGATSPDQPPGPHDWSQKPMAFQLDPGLVSWAFNLSKNVSLSDTPELTKYRASYVGYLNAQRPPFVLIGDTLGSARYWHGAALTRLAENW